jgi:hypothetical protein
MQAIKKIKLNERKQRKKIRESKVGQWEMKG